jgi:hypothetical protein
VQFSAVNLSGNTQLSSGFAEERGEEQEERLWLSSCESEGLKVMNRGKTSFSLDRRAAHREEFEPIEIKSLTSLDHLTLLARHGVIVEASKSGFLLHIDRKEIVPKQFKNQLSLQEIEGDRVFLMIDLMNLEISGRIARTKRIAKDLYEVAIDYSDDAPEYWREILLDMLPRQTDYD